MKRLIATLTIGILVLSFVASLPGALYYRHQQYWTITTARGEVVQVADAGVYRYSLRSLVTSGAPWDVVWLGLVIPALAVAQEDKIGEHDDRHRGDQTRPITGVRSTIGH